MSIQTILLLCVLLVSGTSVASAQESGASKAPAASAPASPPAQQPSGKEEPQSSPIRVFVDEINVQFTVLDGKNHWITDLNKEDFQVLEEKKPQQVTSFSRELDAPLRLGLLIDTSNSIRDRFEFEQKASGDFLRTLLRAGKDKAFLASFDNMAELVMDFTDDLDKLFPAIQSLRSGGGTSLYDAIYFGSRDKLLTEASPTGIYRRAIVILSDGEDNSSRHSRLQALEMAQRAEVTIYSISTNISGISQPGDKILQQFADETGGRYFQPANKEDLTSAFQTIITELRSQYSLSYRSTLPRDGRYHEIQIVPQMKGLHVRARRGYYATNPPGAVPEDPVPPAKSGALKSPALPGALGSKPAPAGGSWTVASAAAKLRSR